MFTIISTIISILKILIICRFYATSLHAFTFSSPDLPAASSLPHNMIPLQHVYNQFGCTGKNQAPRLVWSKPPANTKSFAITLYDPDAPTGSGWWHWIMYNIPKTATSIPTRDDVKQATLLEAVNDYGLTGYGGPCPPLGSKAHRYIFTIYALSVEKIDLPPTTSHAIIRYTIQNSKIKSKEFTSYYERK